MSAPDSTPRVKGPICGYIRRGSQTPCKRPAGDRTDHQGWGYCWIHRGLTPNGIKHAATLKAEAKLLEVRGMFYGAGELPVVDPETVLLDEVRRSYAIVRWLERMIAGWDLSNASEEIGDVIAAEGIPRLGNVVHFDKGGTVTDTEAHAWLKIYREERREARLAAKMALDAGIEERLVRLEEQRAALVVQVIHRYHERAGIELTPDRLAILSAEMRLLDGIAGAN